MNDTLLLAAAAGLAAGFGVAIPLGAIGVLILREGIVSGFARASAGATAVALVDALYCAAAVGGGSAIAASLRSWGDTPIYVSSVALVAFGGWQLWLTARQRGGRRASSQPPRPDIRPARSVSIFVRFFLLTAVNPLTLAYFLALAGAQSAKWSGVEPPLVFIGAVAAASVAWQLILAAVGALFGGSISPRVVEVLGVVGSLIVIVLGCSLILAEAIRPARSGS
ncbi:LysE family transporter [Microbacterium lushaniae]|nr:LysE family transporter [Microbacterium lushaniae]